MARSKGRRTSASSGCELMGITRVLVANRGEIARRVFATCRRLGLGTVAVYTDPDAAAPHVAEADARVRLAKTNDYLNADAIIAAARVGRGDPAQPWVRV